MAHSHTHDHDHGHHHVQPSFNKAFALAAGINLGFTIIETIYALAAHSMSLLADAGHNFFDVVGLLLAWLGLRLLGKKATSKYSYGFKRTSIFAAVINASFIIATAIGIIIGSIYRLANPVLVNEKILVIVALIGIFINGGTAMLFMKGQHDVNIRGAFLHLAYDALISLGVVVTGILIYFTNWLWLDPIIGFLIAIVIFMGTWSLLKKSVDLLLDAVPKHIDRYAVETYLKNLPGVTAVHDLHIWALSTQEVALTVHLTVPNKEIDDVVLHQIQDTLSSQFSIQHATIQIEQNMTSLCQHAKTCC